MDTNSLVSFKTSSGEFDWKKGLFATGLAVATYFTARHFWNKYKKNQEEANAVSDINVQHASIIKNAVGFWGDGSAIINLAKQGMNYKEVVSAYKNLTGGDSMLDDIKKKLSQQKYAEFLMLVSQNTKASTSNIATQNSYAKTDNKGKYFIVINNTSAYDPYKKQTLGFFKKLKDFKAGQMIEGVASQYVLVDKKKGEFLFGAVPKNGKSYVFMVPKKDVRLVTLDEYMAKYKTYRLTKWDVKVWT